MAKTDTAPLESSQKHIAILGHVVRTGGAGVTELAEATSLPKSTVHLHLQSLQSTGLVVKRDSTYRPSLQLLEWGEQVRGSIEVYREARQEIDSLAEETSQLVNLGVIEDGKVRLVYLREAKKGRSKSTAPSVSTEFRVDLPNMSVLGEDYKHTPGKALDVHATAMGKAMLAEMSREEVKSIVAAHGLPRHTEHTITSADRLFAELERIRSRGYAEDDEERVEGLHCVAAAICNDDEPAGAISISTLSERLHGEYAAELADEVTDAANVIEIKLAHST